MRSTKEELTRPFFSKAPRTASFRDRVESLRRSWADSSCELDGWLFISCFPVTDKAHAEQQIANTESSRRCVLGATHMGLYLNADIIADANSPRQCVIIIRPICMTS